MNRLTSKKKQVPSEGKVKSTIKLPSSTRLLDAKKRINGNNNSNKSCLISNNNLLVSGGSELKNGKNDQNDKKTVCSSGQECSPGKEGIMKEKVNSTSNCTNNTSRNNINTFVTRASSPSTKSSASSSCSSSCFSSTSSYSSSSLSGTSYSSSSRKCLMYKGSGGGKIRSIHQPSNQSSTSSLFTRSSMTERGKEGLFTSSTEEKLRVKKSTVRPLRTATAVASPTSKCGGGITVAKVSPLPIGKEDAFSPSPLTKPPSLSIITSSTCSSGNSPPPPAPPSPLLPPSPLGITTCTSTPCTSTPCDGYSILSNKKVIFFPQEQPLVSGEKSERGQKKEKEEKEEDKDLEGKCVSQSLLLLRVEEEGCNYTTIGTNDQNECQTKVHLQRSQVETNEPWIDSSSTNQPVLANIEEVSCEKDLTMHLKVHSSESENELSPYNDLPFLLATNSPSCTGADSLLDQSTAQHVESNSSILPPSLKLMLQSYRMTTNSKDLILHNGKRLNLVGNMGHIITPSVLLSENFTSLQSEISKNNLLVNENKIQGNKITASMASCKGNKNHYYSTLSVNNGIHWSFPASSGTDLTSCNQVSLVISILKRGKKLFLSPTCSCSC